MLRVGVEDVRAAAFAGGTASEIQCGKRAGAGIVAGVLTGGHTGDRLRTAGATHLIDGIAQLPGLLYEDSRPEATGPAVGIPTVPSPGIGPSAPASATSTSVPGPQVPLERRNSGL
jgi:hypothetical protein